MHNSLPSFKIRRMGRFEILQSTLDSVREGVGRGCAYGDYDNDGDLDLLVSNNGVKTEYAGAWLLRNDTEPLSNYLRVKTVGVRSNRDGIGTQVRVTSGDNLQYQMVRTGSSYCSQSETILTFGLGETETVAQLEIQWPSGEVDLYVALKANQTIEAVEGASKK